MREEAKRHAQAEAARAKEVNYLFYIEINY